MTPDTHFVIQGYFFLALLLLLVWMNYQCCQYVKQKVTEIILWLQDHHTYHTKLGQAVCQLEELATGGIQDLDPGKRLCPGGGGDGYGKGDPPEI